MPYMYICPYVQLFVNLRKKPYILIPRGEEICFFSSGYNDIIYTNIYFTIYKYFVKSYTTQYITNFVLSFRPKRNVLEFQINLKIVNRSLSSIFFFVKTFSFQIFLADISCMLHVRIEMLQYFCIFLLI